MHNMSWVATDHPRPTAKSPWRVRGAASRLSCRAPLSYRPGPALLQAIELPLQELHLPGECVDLSLLLCHLLLLLSDPLALLLGQCGESPLLRLQVGESFPDVGHCAIPLDRISCCGRTLNLSE